MGGRGAPFLPAGVEVTGTLDEGFGMAGPRSQTVMMGVDEDCSKLRKGIFCFLQKKETFSPMPFASPCLRTCLPMYRLPVVHNGRYSSGPGHQGRIKDFFAGNMLRSQMDNVYPLLSFRWRVSKNRASAPGRTLFLWESRTRAQRLALYSRRCIL